MDNLYVFFGLFVDMHPHDLLDDTWMLTPAGTKKPLVIGSREQIMDEYDRINATGIIPDYQYLRKK